MRLWNSRIRILRVAERREVRGLMLGRNVGAVVLERNSAGFLDCFIVNGLLEKVLDEVCGWMVVRKRFARSDFRGTSTILFFNTNNSSRLLASNQMYSGARQKQWSHTQHERVPIVLDFSQAAQGPTHRKSHSTLRHALLQCVQQHSIVCTSSSWW